MEPEAPADTSPTFQSRGEKMLYELMKKALTECVTQQSLTEEFKVRALAAWQKLLLEGEKDLNVLKDRLRKDLGKSHGKTYADLCEKIWIPLGNLIKQLNNRKQAVNTAQQQAAASAPPARGNMAAIPPSSVPNKPPNLYQPGGGVYQPPNLNQAALNPFRPMLPTTTGGVVQSRPDPSKIQYTPAPAPLQHALAQGFGSQPLPHQQTTIPHAQPRPPSDQDDLDSMIEKGDLATEFAVDHGRVMDGVMSMQQINEQRHASQPRILQASNVSQQLPSISAGLAGNIMIPRNVGSKSSLSIPLIEPLDPIFAHLIDPTRIETLLQRIVANLSQKITVTDGAKRLLSQGIQNHLLALLENAISTARSRMQLSINMKYRTMYMYFANDRPVDQNVLGDCAMKWGPDTRFLLSREEEKARYFITKFSDLDREHLYRIHKDLVAKKSSTATAGNKRKVEEMESTLWRTADEQAAKEGRMTFEQLANMHFKLQVLNPNAREIIPRSLQLPAREGPEHPFRLTSENQIHLTAKDLLSILREFNSREGNRIVLRALAGKLASS